MIRFLEHRINDSRMLRLIQKWLKAGVMEGGVVTVSDRGTGQGSVISPLLANIYLHYTLDLWAVRWRQRGPRVTHGATPDLRPAVARRLGSPWSRDAWGSLGRGGGVH